MVVAGEVVGGDAVKERGGAEEKALVGAAGSFVRETVSLFITYDADVGRDPLDVNVPVCEGEVVEGTNRAHEGAVCFGVVVFGDGNGSVCAVCEGVECIEWL